MTARWLDLVLALCALPFATAAAYLALLAVLARRRPAPAARVPRLRFDVVVPAHDEEAGIRATVQSLLSVDYPRSLFRVLVVADNCSDATAQRASEAGARVLVRDDPDRRGKGYALEHAFERSLADAAADAVVVVDADTVVSKNLLSAFAAHLEHGVQALQADYGVRNPDTGWRTRLMTIALALFHGVRSLARERLGLSCGLRGNGMAFTHAVIRDVPHRAFSLVEDMEYGILLGLAGYRVGYVPEVQVAGEMPMADEAARSQRRRWEEGRLAAARRYAGTLLAGGVRRRDAVLLDLAADLLVLPLSYLVLASGLGTVAAVVLQRAGYPVPVAQWLWTGSAACLLLYVARGLQLSGAGLRGLLDLAWAPVYVAWKLLLWLAPRRHSGSEWVRTPRERGR